MAIKTKLYARGSLSGTLAPLLALGMLFSGGALVSGQTMRPVPPNPSVPPISRCHQARWDRINHHRQTGLDRTSRHGTTISLVARSRTWIISSMSIRDRATTAEGSFADRQPRMGIGSSCAAGVSAESSADQRDVPRESESFYADEERYDRETSDRNISRSDIVEMNHFLDSHPEIGEQLKKDPSLIDNRQWVANHPALQEYLKTHIDVSAAFRAHPDAFMRDEDRYDRDGDHLGGNRKSADDRNRELTGFGQFLGGHTTIAADLSSDPTLASNKDYLANHPELNDYLQAHPTVSQQLSADPRG